MSTQISSPVTQLLESLSIPYEVIDIPLSEDKKPIRSLEELLTSLNRDPNSVVRSLLFRTGSEAFVLLAVAGGGRADWATLRKHLDERKLRMAEYAEVEEATGYVVGSVPPIALPDSVRVLVDNSIEQFNDVIIGSGVLGHAIALSKADLVKTLSDADFGTFVKER